jgi:hypothetical protein
MHIQKQANKRSTSTDEKNDKLEQYKGIYAQSQCGHKAKAKNGPKMGRVCVCGYFRRKRLKAEAFCISVRRRKERGTGD